MWTKDPQQRQTVPRPRQGVGQVLALVQGARNNPLASLSKSMEATP